MLDRITAGLPIPGLGVARSLINRVTHFGGAPTHPGPAGGLREYVDYGALMTPPAPFRSQNTTLYGFWAQADALRLRALCEKVFAAPSGGAVTCRPISKHVMITWGLIERVDSLTPPYDRYGGVSEPQVAIWVPVILRDPTSLLERFAMFIPYIWLDNAMSLADGRELFGYPKSWGWLHFPNGQEPPAWKVDAFGLNYAPKALAGRHKLLEVKRVRSAEETVAMDLQSLEELARDMAGRLLSLDSFVEGVELSIELGRDILAERMRGVFLKQFRDVRDGTAAAFQQIVEADYTIASLKAGPVLSQHELTVHPLDSHPVRSELGLDSQTLELAYKVEMDFDVGHGRVLWDAGTAAGPCA